MKAELIFNVLFNVFRSSLFPKASQERRCCRNSLNIWLDVGFMTVLTPFTGSADSQVTLLSSSNVRFAWHLSFLLKMHSFF